MLKQHKTKHPPHTKQKPNQNQNQNKNKTTAITISVTTNTALHFLHFEIIWFCKVHQPVQLNSIVSDYYKKWLCLKQIHFRVTFLDAFFLMS